MSVRIRGKEIPVKMKKGQLTLNLSRKKIRKISEVEGLDQLTNLQVLVLNHNKIEEIEGLEALTNLQVLDLASNRIRVIKNLDHLLNLERLYLYDNKIQFVESFNLPNVKLTIKGNYIATKIYRMNFGTPAQNLALFSTYTEAQKKNVKSFWAHIGAKVFLSVLLVFAIIGGIVGGAISINIAGVSPALFWAIPVGMVVGLFVPIIFMMILAMISN